MVMKMAETPIEKLHLSVRASNVLHRMGIHFIEELLETSMEDIAQQRNIGMKTLGEIQAALENAEALTRNADDGPENDTLTKFTDEQLAEMSRHSINELQLSTRSYNMLCQLKYLTIDKVALLTKDDIAQLKGFGTKSIDGIQEAFSRWGQENLCLQMDSELEDGQLNTIMQETSLLLEPIIHLYWKQLLQDIHTEGLQERIKIYNQEEILKTVLQLPQIREKIKNFWESVSEQGVITQSVLDTCFDKLELSFDSALLVDSAIISNVIIQYEDGFLISRDTFLDVYDKLCDQNDRTSQILQFRLEGETLQDIGDLFELSRERVRQITVRYVHKLPLFFEDYFNEPFQYFYISKAKFIKAFPEVTKEGYEFLSIRYPEGKVVLTHESLKEYHGLWKERLAEFLSEEEEQNDKETISKIEVMTRVLISNSDRSLSMDELEDEYYSYIQQKGYPENRLKINLRTVKNYLRDTKGIVFNSDNKVRYCAADPNMIWEQIDFTRYQNTVISSELIFNDYQELMEEADIRDGYELFYIIKSSLSMWDAKRFVIRCRRVPVIVMGEASEEMQAIKLLKEISPVLQADYYAAYEERYGVRRESANGNPAIHNTVGAYYADGKYAIDVPAIDERDIQPLRSALSKKPLWFIEDMENLFGEVCVHTTQDAFNAAAFRRIGYNLHETYVYDASYGTTVNCFEKTIFTKDIVDLRTIDQRILRHQMFSVALDKKKKSLEYIETAPKVLMSLAKVEEVYGLTIEEIREIQWMMSIYYDIPFFNGRSIWREVEDLPIIQKLQGNAWLLTSIMRQQEKIASFTVAGGAILSSDSTSLNLAHVCEWLTSLYGPMSIKSLQKRFNEMFDTQISASRLADRLKASGVWDRIVTDSMDQYIDNLLANDLSNV